MVSAPDSLTHLTSILLTFILKSDTNTTKIKMLGELRLSPQKCALQQPLCGSSVIDSTVGFQLTGPVQLRGTALGAG
jgi:hypothetical protein